MRATVIYRDTVLDFLESRLTLNRDPRKQTSSWTICCITRDELLEQLIIAITERSSAAHETHHRSPPFFDQIQAPELLTPILSRLSASRSSKLVFVNTVSSLRAKLSTITASNQHVADQNLQMSILNLVSLHVGTSEYSVQGLMRTLAGAVEAAARNKIDVLELCECRDVRRPENPRSGPRLWDAEVPLLKGSVKLGEENNKWLHSTLSIRRVAERWFTFETRHQEHLESDSERKNQEGSDACGEDEMLLD